MKKIPMMLCALLALLLPGCGGQESPAPAPETASTTAETTVETAAEPEARHILVACFSATGHTKPLAQAAAQYLNADFYEILPEEPYTQEDLDYGDANSRTSIEQNDSSARPKIAGETIDLAQYDTVILAHPIWWGKAPKILFTFLESYDFSGKTMVSMCTSASSPLGSSAQELHEAVPDSVQWLESRRFSIGEANENVESWLKEIGLA